MKTGGEGGREGHSPTAPPARMLGGAGCDLAQRPRGPPAPGLPRVWPQSLFQLTRWKPISLTRDVGTDVAHARLQATG